MAAERGESRTAPPPLPRICEHKGLVHIFQVILYLVVCRADDRLEAQPATTDYN